MLRAGLVQCRCAGGRAGEAEPRSGCKELEGGADHPAAGWPPFPPGSGDSEWNWGRHLQDVPSTSWGAIGGHHLQAWHHRQRDRRP